jgi:hypothetical protein
LFFYIKLAKWHWSLKTQKKADVIDIDRTGLIASRFGEGSNSAVMTTLPFTKTHYYFQVKLAKLEKFVGIGIADALYMISGGPTLGNYKAGINGCYWT